MTNALPIAQTLLQCLEDALDARPDPPLYRMLRGGDHVAPSRDTVNDECCGGLAWVRIVQTDRAQNYDARGSISGCRNHLRTTIFELGVARCMPTPDAQSMVTADQWNAVVGLMESDHEAMEAAVCCLYDESGGIAGDPDIEVLSYAPAGPDANCIEGTLQVQVTYGCLCGSG